MSKKVLRSIAQTSAKEKDNSRPEKRNTAQSISGVVRVRGSKDGIAGLRIIGADTDVRRATGFGGTVTDEKGAFTLMNAKPGETVEITARGSIGRIIRRIPRSTRDRRWRISLSASELRRLIPGDDLDLRRREEELQREASIRRSNARARTLVRIEEHNRQREFGRKLAAQIDFSSIPKQVRQSDRSYIEQGTPTADASARLLEVARHSIEKSGKKTRKVNLPKDRIEELNKEVGSRGRLPLSKISDFAATPFPLPVDEEALKLISRIYERVRQDGAGSKFSESLGGKTSGRSTEQNAADGEAGNQTSAPTEDQPANVAKDYVEQAIQRLVFGDGEVPSDIGGRADQDTIAGELAKFEVSGGPADVTSIQEFQSLRIAFEPLWTEVFDGELSDLVTEVFKGLERFEEDLPFDEITALNGLKPFLELARELGADLDEAPPIADIPLPVAELLPRMTPRKWMAVFEPTRAELNRLGDLWTAAKTALSISGGHKWYEESLNGWYDKSTGGQVNLTAPDFWRIVGHGARIFFDNEWWVNLSGLPQTVIDLLPDAFEKVVYTFQNSDPPEKYVEPTSKNVIKVEGDSYVIANWAHNRTLTDLRNKAGKALEEGEPDDDTDSGSDIDDPDSGSDTDVARNNLEALARILTEMQDSGTGSPYRFKIFNAGSVNFGILLKYRQAWEPQNYQVGDLVSTIPLAPKESRKYNKRLTVKKSRNRKEIENALQTKSDSEENTGRAEAEIVRRAKNATNFQATAEGKGSIGVVEFGGSASAQSSAQQESAKNKKKFRQAVQKAAHEYRQERSLEISTVDSEETESTESGEISNPNEEITVTYLFYELQKRFLLTETLVDIQPVVLLAHDVPTPSEITESWLIRHDWILKRVLLDDSFVPVFKLLEESNKARDVLIGILRDDVIRKIKAYEEIKDQTAANERVQALTNAALKKAIDSRVEALNEALTGSEEATDVAMTIFSSGLFGSQGLLGVGGAAGRSGDFDNPEAAEARQEAIEDMLARTAEEARRLRSLLEAAEIALDRAVQKYSEAVRARLNKELAVLRLRNHVAQNVLHYMQAIWEYEAPDQRYFRVYDVEVPIIDGAVDVDVGDSAVEIAFTSTGADMDNVQWKRLADVADLDEMIGYKGNYMIFPLREHNFLTAWMVQDFLDQDGNVRDPDYASRTPQSVLNLISDELEAEVTRIQGEPDNEEEWSRLQPVLDSASNMIRRQIELSEADPDDVVVPTDLLFVEALPGHHPLLEDFKLVHRSYDAAKAFAETQQAFERVRTAKLENVRRAARLLDGKFGDPDIDKSISVTGDSGVLISDS